MPNAVTRREIVRLAGLAGAATLLGGRMSAQEKTTPAVDAVDHLLLGIGDLDKGIAWVKEKTGLAAVVGGVHPGIGTRNALLALGGRRYLEIIAPDPAQSTYSFSADVRQLESPRLVMWAARATEIDTFAESLKDTGLQVFGPRDGSRARPDGKTLRWKAMAIGHPHRDGLVDPIPFFIEWAADSPHPAEDSPKGCVLESLSFAHLQAEAVTKTFRSLDITANVTVAPEAKMTAVIRTPKGTIELS
jgi:hypothetical protein